MFRLFFLIREMVGDIVSLQTGIFLPATNEKNKTVVSQIRMVT